MITAEYLITSLIIVLIPGTGVVFTVSTALILGRKAGLFTALGCTLGIVPHLLATILGLATILHTSAVAFQALKFAGAGYLLYVAYASWRDKAAFAIASPSAERSSARLALRACLLNILNPKLTIFFLAFLPQFVDSHAGSPLAQLLLLSGVFMGMTFAVFVIYGILAHTFRKRVIESPDVQSWLRRGFAASFAGLGINLAVSDR